MWSDSLERQVERCYLLKLLPVPLDVIRSILWERILGHRRCVCFCFFPQVAMHSRFESYAQGHIFGRAIRTVAFAQSRQASAGMDNLLSRCGKCFPGTFIKVPCIHITSGVDVSGGTKALLNNRSGRFCCYLESDHPYLSRLKGIYACMGEVD